VIKREYLEAFDDAGNDLVFEAGVLALGVLPDDDDVNVLVARRKAREVEAINERGVEIKLLPQLHIQRAHTAAHRRRQPSLQTHLILLHRFKHLRRHRLHVAVHIVLLEAHRRMHRLHNLFHRAGHQGTDPVARDQCHRPRGAVAGARHVCDGSARIQAGQEVLEEWRGSCRRHRRWIARVLGYWVCFCL